MVQLETRTYYSHLLDETLTYEVSGHWGYPILMFPTTQGQVSQNRDFHLINSVADSVNAGKIKIYNVQTIDKYSFYADWLTPEQRIKNYERYVQFLIQEFIPMLQKENNTHTIATSGCSFGGYHAANLAFRMPHLISHFIGLSAAYSIRSFMDGYDGQEVYFNCPDEYMHGADPALFQNQQHALGTSDWDICKDQNVAMASLLGDKGIPVWYHEEKWIKHDWPLWRMMFPKFIHAYFGA